MTLPLAQAEAMARAHDPDEWAAHDDAIRDERFREGAAKWKAIRIAAMQAAWAASPGPDLLKSLAASDRAHAECRRSLVERALAQSDPDMPLLVPSVVEDIRAESEATYACAETREQRVMAHGLLLICDWQDRARDRAALPFVRSNERIREHLGVLEGLRKYHVGELPDAYGARSTRVAEAISALLLLQGGEEG